MDSLGKIKPGLRVFWQNTPTKSIQITIWGDLGWGPFNLPQDFFMLWQEGEKNACTFQTSKARGHHEAASVLVLVHLHIGSMQQTAGFASPLAQPQSLFCSTNGH